MSAAILEETPRQALVRALAAARAEVKPVERDGQSEGTQSYAFASAEAVLTVAVPLLGRHGLVILPDVEAIDEDAKMLRSRFLLAHASGGEQAFNVDTPIVIVTYCSGGSTPRDKAVGAARTVSLRVAHRTILGLPSAEKGEDIEHRDESGRQDQPKPRPQQRPQRSSGQKPSPAAPEARDVLAEARSVDDRAAAEVLQRAARALGPERCRELVGSPASWTPDQRAAALRTLSRALEELDAAPQAEEAPSKAPAPEPPARAPEPREPTFDERARAIQERRAAR